MEGRRRGKKIKSSVWYQLFSVTTFSPAPVTEPAFPCCWGSLPGRHFLLKVKRALQLLPSWWQSCGSSPNPTVWPPCQAPSDVQQKGLGCLTAITPTAVCPLFRQCPPLSQDSQWNRDVKSHVELCPYALSHILPRQLSLSEGADQRRCRWTTTFLQSQSIPGLTQLTHSGADSVAAVKSELHCNHWDEKATKKNNSSSVVLCIQRWLAKGKKCVSPFSSRCDG